MSAARDDARQALERAGLTIAAPAEPPPASGRFADGAAWHVEIPSVEGPAAMQAALEAGARLSVPIHRVSQGSGIWLLSNAEIERMVALGREHEVEVCLFVGPRAAWDAGVQATTPGGRTAAGSLRGPDGLLAGVEEVRRGCELGLRSVLVADLGLLSVLARLRAAGELPADLGFKVSASFPVANPATAHVLEEIGATTLNLPVDLSVAQIASIRAAVSIPVDFYVEAPDDLGGTLRYYDLPALVRTAAPIHLKFGLRNAPGIYPSGGHLEGVAVETARERVRRAALGLALLARLAPELVEKP